MAGHLPIGQAGFEHVVKKNFTKKRISEMIDFERNFDEKLNCMVQKLPANEYKMDEQHGKRDKYVIYFYKLDVDNYSYQVNIDKDLNVNEVYLVL